MGTFAGNALALICMIAAGLLGFVSLEVSTYAFIIAAYAIGLLIWVMHFAVSRTVGTKLISTLNADEVSAFRRFNIAIRTPGAGELFSAYLNFVRISGIIWGGICIWNGMYLLGGIVISFFFFSSGLIVRLNPYLYIAQSAQKGNHFADYQLMLIQSVRDKYSDAYSGSDGNA